MPTTPTNNSKNNAAVTNTSKPTPGTWDENTQSWDETDSTWDVGRVFVDKPDKSNSTVTNASKS